MKGKTNNPNGGPKGTPNKSTVEIRHLISNFVSLNIEGLQNNFDQLEPKDRLLFFEKLLQYALPKQKESLEDHTDNEPVVINIIGVKSTKANVPAQ